MNEAEMDALLTAWLQEDVQTGDATCACLFPETLRAEGEILFKERGVVCGLNLVRRLYERVDADIRWETLIPEGSLADEGQPAATLSGLATSILVPERLGLNLLGHLSGVATLARSYLEAVEGLSVDLVDTRKTMPGLRSMEKYATRTAGWVNHRMGLHDLVLIKDNHLAALRASGEKDPIARALQDTENSGLGREIEVQTPEEAALAAGLGAEMILLDNMTPSQLAEAVKMSKAENPEVVLEASGGVSLDTVRAVAESGVDRISVGKATHSAPSLDVSLEVRFHG